MCWLGVESGGKFLYIGRHDEQVRTCFLVVRHTIHGDDLMPANTVKFKRADEGQSGSLVAKDDGLYLVKGLVILVK